MKTLFGHERSPETKWVDKKDSRWLVTVDCGLKSVCNGSQICQWKVWPDQEGYWKEKNILPLSKTQHLK